MLANCKNVINPNNIKHPAGKVIIKKGK